jgi:hypothetical protein
MPALAPVMTTTFLSNVADVEVAAIDKTIGKHETNTILRHSTSVFFAKAIAILSQL